MGRHSVAAITLRAKHTIFNHAFTRDYSYSHLRSPTRMDSTYACPRVQRPIRIRTHTRMPSRAHNPSFLFLDLFRGTCASVPDVEVVFGVGSW